MNTEIIIPWAGNCVYRGLVRDWVVSRWRDHGFEVTLAEQPHGGPWCKAEAVTPAVVASDADVIVVTDGDVWTDDVFRAIDAVTNTHPWACPFAWVKRLDPASTSDVLAGADLGGVLEKPQQVAVPGGGMVVLRRDVYLQVPLDPEFKGWGFEDDCWGRALRVMYGPPWRGSEVLWHLWHPPQDRGRHRPSKKEGRSHQQRYYKPRQDRVKMDALLQEARTTLGLVSTP